MENNFQRRQLFRKYFLFSRTNSGTTFCMLFLQKRALQRPNMLSCCLLCTSAEVTASRTKTLQISELRWAGGIPVVCFLPKKKHK